MVDNPFSEDAEAKLATTGCLGDEFVGSDRIDFQIVTVQSKKCVGKSEADLLFAVDEGMIVRQRLHQSSRLINKVVIRHLRTKNGGLQSPSVTEAVRAAKSIDWLSVDFNRFGYGRVEMLLHLLRQKPKQFPVLFGLTGDNGPRPLAEQFPVTARPPGNRISGLLQQEAPTLPVFLSHLGQVSVQAGINFKSDLPCGRSCHVAPPYSSFPIQADEMLRRTFGNPRTLWV
jgi:hypothetical protein